MPPTLDEGTVGIKVLAGLPDGNGLPAIAERLLDDPQPVFALVELRPRHEVHNIDTDSHTLVLRISQIEPLTGADGARIRDELRAVREKRTGVVAIPGVDDQPPAVEVTLDGTGDETVPGRVLPTGPEWGDGEVPSEADVAATGTGVATPAAPAGTVPPFTEPTPISKKRRG